MSTQYDSYGHVPWFRKWWFAAIGIFVFMPAIVVMAFTGDFYFSKEGKAKTFPEWVKFGLLGWCLLAIAPFVIGHKSTPPNAVHITKQELNTMLKEAMEKPVQIQAPASAADLAPAPDVSSDDIHSMPHTACAGSKAVFACTTTKGKAVEVCDSGETLKYRFGQPGGKPDMALSVPRAKATTFQWDGRGNSIHYSVQIPNGNTVYEVFTSTDRMSDQHAMTAGINVEVAGKHAATLACQTGTVVNGLEGISLKAAAWQ